ncbi:MAG: nicotinamide mononucleotide transporter [Proteobacteria bacterium]|uniref:nicotinamide riboside transporter PnuC n=1 Tax=Rudaea sp. TaxID=2136325 RepID=UPI001DE359FF|nr:nicotinamide mononucleotide transporter [Pseudomonadota bacterium]MBS0567779.1 nicotinamide mononucleotide transporter [Pseudomonadota bacterium]
MLDAIGEFLDATAFTALATPVSNAELIGFAAGAGCVWLAARQNALNFPLALVNAVTFGLLFADKRLYGDAVLQAMFFSLNLLGWWRWWRGDGEHHALPVSRLSPRGWLVAGAAMVVVVPSLQQALIMISGAAPFLDAVITTLSVIAQVLLNRKTLENWWLWIVVDLISVPLYVSKGLYLTALLYVVFLLMCIGALFSWRRSLRDAAPSPA